MKITPYVDYLSQATKGTSKRWTLGMMAGVVGLMICTVVLPIQVLGSIDVSQSGLGMLEFSMSRIPKGDIGIVLAIGAMALGLTSWCEKRHSQLWDKHLASYFSSIENASLDDLKSHLTDLGGLGDRPTKNAAMIGEFLDAKYPDWQKPTKNNKDDTVASIVQDPKTFNLDTIFSSHGHDKDEGLSIEMTDLSSSQKKTNSH